MSTTRQPSRGELSLWAVRGAGFGIGLLAIVVIASVGNAAMGVLLLIVVSLLLAAAIDPLVLVVRDRVGLSRVKIILLLYVVLAGLAVGLVALLAPAVADQLLMLSERLPGLIEAGRTWASTVQPALVGSTLEQLITTLGSTLTRSGITSPEPATLVEAGLTATDALLAVMSVATMVFFWLISRAAIQRFALSMFTLKRRGEVRSTWNQIEGRLGQWLRGQLIVMTVVGSAAALAYTVLGLPDPLVLGVIAGLTELIPIVGPAIGAIPAVISAFVTGGPTQVVLVVLVYVVIQVVEGQVLVPIVMRDAVGVPPFLVIASLLIGGAVGGIAGALLAVPVMAAVVIVLEHAQARKEPVHLDTLDLPEDGEEEADGLAAEPHVKER